MHRTFSTLLAAAALMALPASAATVYVAPGGTGNGSPASPFGRVTDALAVAMAGDEVVLRPGTYAEAIRTVRGGTSDQRIVASSRIAASEPGCTRPVPPTGARSRQPDMLESLSCQT